jgi:hypothetical protein
MHHAWWSLVLREVFGHGNEDDLVYPGDDALVIDHLFARLREFPESRAAVGSGG